jgi:hypothetical protein
MTKHHEKNKEFTKSEICSVADRWMDIEPEDNFSRPPVYCLKHDGLETLQYWLESVSFGLGFSTHKGIRIHRTRSSSVHRRSFVDLFSSVNSFSEQQTAYIVKVILFVLDCVAPNEQKARQKFLSNYVNERKGYCYNYYSSSSEKEDFYIVDGFIKFEEKPLSEHIKLNFKVSMSDRIMEKDIHFYVYGDDLMCATKFENAASLVVDIGEDPTELASQILKPLLVPLIKKLDYDYMDITSNNIKEFFDNIGSFKTLTDMVDI